MKKSRNLAAAVLAVVASAVLSFIDNFVAAVSVESGLWQFQVFRTLFALPLLLAAAFVAGTSIRPKNPKKLAVWRFRQFVSDT